ncbi:MAG: glycosyltransferase, partial [Bradymonadaceae bacterium]
TPDLLAEARDVLETPVVASHLPGNIGLLGEDYPGLFKPKDERDLAKRLDGAEKNNRYYNELQARCREKRALFDLDRERDAWEDLIDEIE